MRKNNFILFSPYTKTIQMKTVAKGRVTEYVRLRGSLDDLKLLGAVTRFKQVSKYLELDY